MSAVTHGAGPQASSTAELNAADLAAGRSEVFIPQGHGVVSPTPLGEQIISGISAFFD
jgi:hypothetical protein